MNGYVAKPNLLSSPEKKNGLQKCKKRLLNHYYFYLTFLHNDREHNPEAVSESKEHTQNFVCHCSVCDFGDHNLFSGYNFHVSKRADRSLLANLYVPY